VYEGFLKIERVSTNSTYTMCDSEYDKYTFKHEVQVDCQSRLHICKAVCCRFPFALSRQDVEEGIINWEFGRSYLIANGKDGDCVHLDGRTIDVWCVSIGLCPARGLTARIMRN